MRRPCVEIAKGHPNDIHRRLKSPKTLVNTPVAVKGLRRVIGQNNAEIKIAVRARVSSCRGPKKIDANRSIELDQPPRNLLDRLYL